jgi:LytS/YehU family sensor histidine kinase
MTWIRAYAMELASGFGRERFLPAFLFWVDVWAIVYITLVVIGGALDLRRRYADRTMRADLLEAQLARAQLQFLESQLQPHFLFNALNTIQELAHEAPHAAERTLHRLRSLLAISLERYGYDEVTLGDELAGLEPYLDIQRTRFSDWLSVDLDVPADAREALVPHLVLQPLVENAIRHGLSVRQAPGRIGITARREGEWLRVVVEDDGVGLAPSAKDKRAGIGLQNVADRLRQLYGSEHRFVIGARRTGGVEVTLKVPYRVGVPMTSPPQPLDTLPSEDEIASWRTGEFEGSRIENGRSPRTGEFPRLREATILLAEGDGRDEADEPVLRTTETSPALSLRAWVGIAGVWLLLAVFWTNQIVLLTSAARTRNAGVTLWSLAEMQVVTSIIWLVMSLPVLWFARRFRLTPDNWPFRLPVHVALALACGFIHLGTMRLVGISEAPVLTTTNMNPLTGDFFIYLAFLAWSHSRDFVAWFRQRDLETARLSAQIARSRFQNLRVQLRPEFLLATLERLSDLVHTDVDRAERLIVRLADTLRQTLDLSRESLVSLAQELELVSASIETHRLGIRRGVSLELAIDEEALSEPIPSRLVCTLVDELLANVAIAPDSPLQVGIDATRVSGYTQITVSANAADLGTRDVSHTWFQRQGVAERAVRSAGAGVSVLIPDQTSVMVMVGTETRVDDVGLPPVMVAAGGQ